MATLVNYWRIIKPDHITKIPNQITRDNAEDWGADVAMMQWYTQIMKGETARLSRYKQFDNMDADIDISRALDTISEEVSSEDRTSNLPFEIEYQVENNQEVSESVVTTIRAAVRQWVNFLDLNNKIFKIVRYTVKYGDCFFRRVSPLKKWQFIDPDTVIGIEINNKGEKVAYHLKKDVKDRLTGSQKVETSIIPANEIIHFTLSDEMGPSAPFGESILNPVVRTFKQLTMLEDSIIIYRIVRAPERRVFYIDVGNMPAQRVKQYMEQIKNDIRQKRQVGKNAAGQDIVDGSYNPNSIQEDYFFPVTTSGRGSRVETLPGGDQLGENSDLKYFQEKIFRGMRIPTSYMRGSDAGGAQIADGKVGIAYIEELRFANFIKRLQAKVEKTFDDEFKLYMNNVGIKVDDDLFLLKLPDPQNFALYRQAALDSELINTFQTAESIKYMSRRFILKRFLGFSEDDLQMNESMLKQERGIRDDQSISDLQQIYDPAFFENRDAIKLLDEELSSPPEEGEGGGGEDLGMGAEGEPGLEAGGETPPEETPPEETPPEETPTPETPPPA